ncbi:hypothetical protein TWF718_000386 [Orbilia javanica]|uniref:Uncharacterized protein n=1 Tax=Orbilia javanica TaxID=47235 RepID=A0AAN8MZM4_9PEZI
MVGFVKGLITVMATCCLLVTAAAVPAPEVDYVNLIKTAPGYPTVKELGLTNEDFAQGVPELRPLVARSLLEKRVDFKPYCRVVRRCTVSDAEACFKYLSSLGDKACDVGVLRVQLCRMGDCAWNARPVNTFSGTKSSCLNVAMGGSWILKNCVVNGQVSGLNTAYGNGNMVIDISGPL